MVMSVGSETAHILRAIFECIGNTQSILYNETKTLCHYKHVSCMTKIGILQHSTIFSNDLNLAFVNPQKRKSNGRHLSVLIASDAVPATDIFVLIVIPVTLLHGVREGGCHDIVKHSYVVFFCKFDTVGTTEIHRRFPFGTCFAAICMSSMTGIRIRPDRTNYASTSVRFG